MRARFHTIALACGLTTSGAVAQGRELNACMHDLATCLRAALAGAESGDAAAAAAEGGKIEKLAAQIPGLAHELDASLAADVRWHSAQVAHRGNELAADTDLAAQRARLAGLRGACTACHVEFRERGESGVPWPAAGEALLGRVRVRTVDGQPRDDAHHVVVFLEGVQRPASAAARGKIVQQDKAFVPDLLVVTAGTTVEFPNLDAVFHNVFSLAMQQPFDLGMYGRGETRAVAFTQPGLVKIYCNIHPEMVAHVLVLRGPDAAIAAPSGFFALVDLPPGEFMLRTWSEFGGDLSRPVGVKAGPQPTLVLEMQETQRRLPHANKFGHAYRDKY